ncbi:MAG: hypothetical protein HQL29_03505 [Candidatus Omnitrophica bacterium]|nr:hypothetical protein [Candidatus Omnitrophota bacterium]
MKKREIKKKEICTDDSCGSCANESSKQIWVIGIVGIILVTLFSIAMFNSGAKKLPADTAMQAVAFNGFMQQAAVPPACATCPTVAQCFPAQPVAFQQGGNPPQGAVCPTGNQYYSAQPMQQQQQSVMQQGMQQVALAMATPATATAPVIFRDAIMPHEFRGVCSNCHVIQADIPILRDAIMPHNYRGVCSNCHKIMPDIAITRDAVPPHEYRGVCSNCHVISGMKAGA